MKDNTERVTIIEDNDFLNTDVKQMEHCKISLKVQEINNGFKYLFL